MSENIQFTNTEHKLIQHQLDKWLEYPAGRLDDDEIDIISTFNNVSVKYPSFMSGFILGCLFAKKNTFKS